MGAKSDEVQMLTWRCERDSQCNPTWVAGTSVHAVKQGPSAQPSMSSSQKSPVHPVVHSHGTTCHMLALSTLYKQVPVNVNPIMSYSDSHGAVMAELSYRSHLTVRHVSKVVRFLN